MRRTVMSLIAVLLLVPCASVSAQHPPTIKPGAHVRVTAPGHSISQYTGVVTAMENGTLAVDTLVIALLSVTWLEVSRPKSAGGLGILAGFSVGAVAGSVVRPNPCDETGPGAWDSSGDCISAGIGKMFAYGVVGAALGGPIGSLFSLGNRWVEVPLDHFQLSVAPQSDGRLGLGMSVSF